MPARRTGVDGDQPCKKAVDGDADGPVQLRATSSLDQFCSVVITVSVYFVCVSLWCACSVCVRVRKPPPGLIEHLDARSTRRVGQWNAAICKTVARPQRAGTDFSD